MLPIRIKRYTTCTRCGLMYPQKKQNCHHCTGLDEEGLANLREKIERKHDKLSSYWGVKFGLMAAILLLIMVGLGLTL